MEHKAVESVTAVELSRIVAEAAAHDFDQFNHGICRNSKAKIHVEDARIYLESCREAFDVIVGDLFTPWRPGEASLSSFEEFRAARRALRSGGVFCQWIELTQWTPEQFQVAAATFRTVFTRLYLFRTSFATDNVQIGLVGFKDGGPDWTIVGRRCRFERDAGRVADPLCRHPEGVAMLYLGEFTPAREFQTQVNTLNNLRIELSASREVVLIDSGTHYIGAGGPWLDLLDRQTADLPSSGNLPETLRACPKLGALLTRFEIAMAQNAPGTDELARTLTDKIAPAIREDRSANWKLWAGSITPWEFLRARDLSALTNSPGTIPK